MELTPDKVFRRLETLRSPVPAAVKPSGPVREEVVDIPAAQKQKVIVVSERLRSGEYARLMKRHDPHNSRHLQ